MLLLLFVLSIPIMVTITYHFLHSKKKGHLQPPPPGPPGLPFIGNLHQFLNNTTTSSSSPHEYLWKLSKKYGPVMSLRFGSIPVVLISSAKGAEQALRDQDIAFSGRPKTLSMQKFSYNGLDFACKSYGQYWKEMRKIALLHLYGTKRVQSFRHIRENEVSLLIKKIIHETEEKKDENFINISEMVMCFAMNLICRISFGKRVNRCMQDDDQKRFKELFLESQGMMASFFFSDYFPWFGWAVDKVIKRVNYSKLEKNFRDFDFFYQEIIDDHLKKKSRKEEDDQQLWEAKEEDIVDILFKVREEKSTPFDLSFDHIKAMLMNIVVPGTDPVAATIIWTMTALMKNPTAMDNLQQQIRKLVAKKGSVEEDDIQNLPYLKAVIMETLRLYPPVPLLVPRTTMEKCTIDSYQIQQKTLVYFNEWAISRDPNYWENPNEFSPQRFLDRDNNNNNNSNNNSSFNYNELLVQKNFALFPFGGGRRICPGVNLGVAAVKLAVANLVYRFDWKLPPGMKEEDVDFDVLRGITMYKKNDLCLVVAKSYV